MKQILIVLTVLVLISSAMFLTSFNTPSENVVTAEDRVMEAHMDLYKAHMANLADMEKYRQQAIAKMEANNKSIANLRSRIKTEREEVKAEDKRKIAELEQMNTKMKKRLEDNKVTGKEN